MRMVEPPFDVEYLGNQLQIAEHELAGKRVFHVNFGRSVTPLVISIGIGLSGDKFWTSIPQGRQKEAAEIGKLIAEHIRAKRK